MLAPEPIEQYRRMTSAERLALPLKMTREKWPNMLSGPPGSVDRRFDAGYRFEVNPSASNASTDRSKLATDSAMLGR